MQLPEYTHAPHATDLKDGAFDKDSDSTGPDFSEDLKDIRSGGGFDKARKGKVGGDRGGDSGDREVDDHPDHD